MAVDIEFVDKSRHQTVREIGDAVVVFNCRDDRKFVAAKPRQEDFSGDGAQTVRDLAQQRIADGMAVNVVDALEAVEIDAQHGEASALGLGQVQGRA